MVIFFLKKKKKKKKKEMANSFPDCRIQRHLKSQSVEIFFLLFILSFFQTPSAPLLYTVRNFWNSSVGEGNTLGEWGGRGSFFFGDSPFAKLQIDHLLSCHARQVNS